MALSAIIFFLILAIWHISSLDFCGILYKSENAISYVTNLVLATAEYENRKLDGSSEINGSSPIHSFVEIKPSYTLLKVLDMYPLLTKAFNEATC